MACSRQYLPVEVIERLKVMQTQEASHYAVPDYLAAEWQQKLRDEVEHGADDPRHGGLDAYGSSSSQINERWREKISDWCFGVVDHFGSDREVVYVAMSYLDRYLASRTVNRQIFQLAAMTALHLANKLYQPGKLRMSSLIDLSRGYFMAEHIIAMEESMLRILKWHVNPPTPFAFCHDFISLVSGDIRHRLTDVTRFLTELSVCDYWFATKKSSSIALAAIINAIELQGSRRVDPRYKVEFLHRIADTGMDIAKEDEIHQCYERLRELYIAGGYEFSFNDEGEDGDQVDTVSPFGVIDGPDTYHFNDYGLPQIDRVWPTHLSCPAIKNI